MSTNTFAVLPTVTLKQGSGSGTYSHGGDTSYTDVDGTNLAYTVTIPTGWKLIISASGNGGTLTAATYYGIAIYDGGSAVKEMSPYSAAILGASTPFSLDHVITGDGASHTIKLRYKTFNASDSAAIENSSSTARPSMVFILTPSN